jgi:hypothetical protein
MIVRVLTARVPDGNAFQFNVLLRQLLDELRGQPGLAYAKLARRLEPGGEEVILFEEWLTPNDLWRWTGGQLGRPRLMPGTEELVENLLISHYESLDVDPESLELSTIAGAADANGSLTVAGEGSAESGEDVAGHVANGGWRRPPSP